MLETNPHDTAFIPLLAFKAAGAVLSGTLPVTKCYVHANGVPSWELMKAMRLAFLGPQERPLANKFVFAGQPYSADSERRVSLGPLHP